MNDVLTWWELVGCAGVVECSGMCWFGGYSLDVLVGCAHLVGTCGICSRGGYMCDVLT